ncbi:berberine bridge enzyme-like 18 [Curcuma longa]|uniref:berberine bridge enzyme-like 18 n=1 Tax=Curcuma longa TaxID=136217 RepID=UPI003D9E3390
MKENDVLPSAFTIISLLSLLLTSPPPSAFSSATGADDHAESFAQCFIAHTAASSSQLIFPRNATSYDALLRSSVQNIRFLHSADAVTPILIVTPTHVSHAQAAVLCARRCGLGLRARSGGHDYEGMSYVSDPRVDPRFVLLDLFNLRAVTVDSDSRTAWVQAGATLGELYYAISSESSTAGFPAGICPTVGVGGHFSGGGIGTLSRKYGAAADAILDAEVVDADGRLLTRESMGEDFFWAIRGGGAASFGLVVSFKIKLVDVPPVVTAFNVIRTLKQNATRLLSQWQVIAPALDRNLYVRAIAQATNRTIQVVFNSLYLGTCSSLLAVLSTSFPELGVEAGDCHEMTWLESVLFFDNRGGEPAKNLLGRRPEFSSFFKAKSDFITHPISDVGWEEVWSLLTAAKDEPLTLVMEPLGGALSEVAESAIPFPHRKGNLYLIQYFMRWFETDVETTERHLRWMRMLYDFMARYASANPRAAYVNYRDIDLGRNGDGEHGSYAAARDWGRKYFKSNFERLTYVKTMVDPDDFFRNEQSIPPLDQLN